MFYVFAYFSIMIIIRKRQCTFCMTTTNVNNLIWQSFKSLAIELMSKSATKIQCSLMYIYIILHVNVDSMFDVSSSVPPVFWSLKTVPYCKFWLCFCIFQHCGNNRKTSKYLFKRDTCELLGIYTFHRIKSIQIYIILYQYTK